MGSHPSISVHQQRVQQPHLSMQAGQLALVAVRGGAIYTAVATVAAAVVAGMLRKERNPVGACSVTGSALIPGQGPVLGGNVGKWKASSGGLW